MFLLNAPLAVQVPDNYTPPAPITAPVMGFPVEAPQPHEHAQVPPGAPQEPSMQVGVQQVAALQLSQQKARVTRRMCENTACLVSSPGSLSSSSSCRQKGWSRRKSQPNTRS